MRGSAEPGVVALATCRVDAARHRVVFDGGAEASLTALEAGLFAHLAARAGEDVGRDELLRAVWGHAAITATRAVDYTVARLRTKLGEPSTPRHLITVHGFGYRLVLASPSAPTPAAEPGPPPLALPCGALDLTRRRFVRADGEPVTLSRLEAELLSMLVDAAGAVVPRDALIARGWGRGRHDASLDALLRRLRRRIGDADGTTLVTVRGSGLRLELGPAPAAPTAPAGPPLAPLPPARSPFEPRPELAAVEALLDDDAVRVITVRGVAGVGKTRLALELAHRRARDLPTARIAWCELASHAGPLGIPLAVASALALHAGGGDVGAAVGGALAQDPGPLLVVLDNVEHLTPWVPVVAGWAAGAPSVRFLATSREALGLDGERVVDLLPLAEDAARRLFAARAGDAAIAPDDPAVGALVNRLDRLPLALELAAARVADLGLAELSRRLGASLDVLVRRAAGTVSQHSTLRGAFDASWDLLSAAERAAFARCGVFAGPFSAADAATVIGGPDVDAHAALDALIRRSLVHRGPDGALRLLDSLRAYAVEKLAVLGLEASGWAAHRAAIFARLGPFGGWHGASDTVVLLAMRALRPELELVWARATDPDDRALAAIGLEVPLVEDGPVDAWLERLRVSAAEGPRPQLAWRIWRGIAIAERAVGLPGQGLDAAERALAVAATTDPEERARAEPELHRLVGVSARRLGQVDVAAAAFARAEAGFAAIGDPVSAATVKANLAFMALQLGSSTSLRETLASTGRALGEAGATRLEGRLLRAWAVMELELSAPRRAERLFAEAEALDRRSGHGSERLAAEHAWVVAGNLRRRGRFAEADDAFGRLAARYTRMGSAAVQQVLFDQATACVGRGAVDRAVALADEAMRHRPASAEGAMSADLQWGWIVHLTGRFAEAERAYTGIARSTHALRRLWGAALRAMALADLDRPVDAAEHLDVARAIAQASDAPWVGTQVALADAALALCAARAGGSVADAVSAAYAAIAAATARIDGSFVLADVNDGIAFGAWILERAIDRTIAPEPLSR